MNIREHARNLAAVALLTLGIVALGFLLQLVGHAVGQWWFQ